MVATLSATAAAQSYPADFDFGEEEFDFSWDDVAPAVDAEREKYEAQLAIADQYATAAAQESVDPYASDAAKKAAAKRRAAYTTEAIEAYEAAIELMPDEPEPYYRAGLLLYNAAFSPSVGREIIRYWNTVERLVPLDPRVTGILFQRALTHTRMATDEHVRKGIDDYETLLRRQDVNTLTADTAGVRLNNLAEMYMMVGELETAITLYRRALSYAHDVSFAYGLAVALDRDAQGVKAREVMADYIGSFGQFLRQVNSGATFYVPEGEVFYYLGMAYEAIGQYADAIASFESFIASGAHPRYHARAKENISDLKAKKAAQPAAPSEWDGYGF